MLPWQALMSIPGSWGTAAAVAGLTGAECPHGAWALLTAPMSSARGWVIFSGWTGVGVNTGLVTGTFWPDTVTAQAAPPFVVLGDGLGPVMPGTPAASVNEIMTAAAG